MVSRTVRILVADDHALVRESVVDRLDRELDYRVVGCADNPEQVVRKVLELEPDVLLMDVDMGMALGFEAARYIRAMRSGLGLIFLSGFVYDRYIQEALDMQANGYVSKHDGFEELVSAIREVARGGRFFSSAVSERLLLGPNGVQTASAPKARGTTLTSREVQVLRNISLGLAKKTIAARLNLSVKTVETHCDNLMAKLAIRGRVKLARYAIREGLANL